MKRIIKPENLPEVLDEETIEILVEMCEEFPKKDFSWRNVSELLLQRGQLNLILDIVQKNQEKKFELERSRMTQEEKKSMEESHQKMLEKLEEDPFYFYGNMSRPDSAEEYKSRYGVWPPGYDENGNKM